MLTSDTKRHIDAARQVLVGKVPNPISQIQEITNALVYKFMDDMDEKAASMGGKRRYFTGEYAKYSWRAIMDPKIGAHERIGLYTEALSRLSKNPNLPELFRNIFRNAYLPFNDGRVLTLFLKEIDYFDYSKSQELGDAYEYLLSIMGSQGDAGQFRTPRHIIDFMVAVINPTKSDSVLDPACGTAGFLISAYKHVMAQHDGVDEEGKSITTEKPLTADEKKHLHAQYKGFDIDDSMVKMAQVNLYLHGFPDPKIMVHDTLSSQDYWQDRYDVILANPPFMSPKGGSLPHNKFGIKSTRSEVLFVDYITSHLKPHGRAAIIVPEGIIFQSGKAHKELRQHLVNDGLYAVVSLPSGVFNPYAGVKTSILLFDNSRAKETDQLLFVKINNDGYDLGATKRKIAQNDLPEAEQILNLWKQGKKSDSLLALYVHKSKIAEGGDYNLSGDRYRVATDYSNAKWPMVELGKVIRLDFGERITKNSKQGTKYPVYGGGGESFRTNEYNRKNEYVIARFAMSESCVRFVSGPFWMMDSGGTFSIKTEYQQKLNKDFVGKILLSLQEDILMCSRGGAQKNLNNEHFYEIKIPLPPLAIQEQVVSELDGYAAIISGARQIVTSWKPSYITDPEWEIRNLLDVCIQITDGTHKTPVYTAEGVPFLRVTDITESNQSKKFISRDEHNELLKRCKPEKGDVLYTKNGTIGIARMIDWSYEFSIFVSLALLKPKNELLHSKYLEHFLNSSLALEQAKAHSKSGTITNLHLVEIKQFQIPLPPLPIQKEIVAKIEAERALVDSAKKLIEIYEQKTKAKTDSLWEVK